MALWLVLRRLDVTALARTLHSMKWGWYLGAQAAFGVGLLGSAIRWHLILRLNPGAVVHGAASVRMVFISQLFNVVFGGPSGGDIPKTALYSRWFAVPAPDVLAASVLDRLVSSCGGILFGIVAVGIGAASGGFAFLSRWRWHAPGGWVWVVAAAVLTAFVAVPLWARRRPASFLGRALGSLRHSARRLLASSRHSGQALACTIVACILFNVTQVLCLQAVFSGTVPWLKLFWLFQAVSVVAALPVTVAGTGLREGAALILLPEYGISATAAVAGAMLTLSVQLSWALFGLILLTREHRLRRGVAPPAAPKRISAIIPTLNESEDISETIAHLRAVPELSEFIVVDGGSEDGTSELAHRLGCLVVRAPRGRGRQMRRGAEAATGDVIVFVHADTWVPPHAGQAIVRCLRDPLIVGGGFWKRFRRPALVMRGARFKCWLRLWWAGRILGDQAIFVRRTALEKVGGVPEQPLMEEIELCRRLRGIGRLALAGAAVTTSERRFSRRGVFRTYWLMWRIARAYRRGVPPEELVRRYDQG